MSLDILDAAMDRLAGGLISYGGDLLPIAWPDQNFAPPSSESALWLEPSLFPAENDNIVLAAGPVLFRGFFQILVGFRKGPLGQRPAHEVAEDLVALFAKGVDLGPVKVSTTPSIRPTVSENDKSFLPVSAPYIGLA